jgi:hypothetical protein
LSQTDASTLLQTERKKSKEITGVFESRQFFGNIFFQNKGCHILRKPPSAAVAKWHASGRVWLREGFPRSKRQSQLKNSSDALH